MTTHDEQTNTTTTPTADVDPVARPESSSAGTEPSTAQTVQSAADDPSSATMRTDPPPYVKAEPLSARVTESSTAQPNPRRLRTGVLDRRRDRTVDRQIAFRRRRPFKAALALG